MTVEDNRTTSPPVDVPTGRYRLRPELTTVSFSARKLGLFTIRGTMRLVSGTFTMARPPDRSTLHAVLAADSFATPMRKRDEHVKGPTLLDTATYPHIEFDSTEVAAVGDGWEIRGLLALHGKVAPAVLAVEATSFGDGLAHVRAHARIDRRQFGVTRQRAAASSVIEVRIEAVGSPVRETHHDG